jgi:ribosomal protein S18 acetylase RimI-like enzyme
VTTTKKISHTPSKPYRSRGVGSQCLDLVVTAAAAQTKPKISRVYLHVQTSNTAGKAFYERHGFVEVGVHKNYYKKIAPHDAWILERVITTAPERKEK